MKVIDNYMLHKRLRLEGYARCRDFVKSEIFSAIHIKLFDGSMRVNLLLFTVIAVKS